MSTLMLIGGPLSSAEAADAVAKRLIASHIAERAAAMRA